jgi:hypothetical protein
MQGGDIMRSHRLLGAVALVLTLLLAAVGAPATSAAPPACVGTPEAPGVLSGSYPSNVIVEGACAVNAGVAVVGGDLTLKPGAVLLAAFAHDDRTGAGSSRLVVHGDLRVQEGAALLLGCDPQSFACIDDPSQSNPTLSSHDLVYGNLVGRQPLGEVVHNTAIDGNVQELGGGGGLSCEPSGIFAAFHVPVYSAYEDSTVHGNLSVKGLVSCWLGIARVHVNGSLRLNGDQLADPDAIEILANHVAGNLACHEDSQVWDSAEAGAELFPRTPGPNTVLGQRVGQCVLASPTTEGGPPGPGPF